ncbi:hypothetical protein DFS33DRAFT_172208 [Desarmillaria ectypa]|nr:hypothetical protein DFS33DRAFT_172208 [Desarmillaria ectypa]
MLRTRLAVLLFSFFVLLVGAIPTPNSVSARGDEEATSAQDVLLTLKASTDDILPQINSLVANGAATRENVTPHLNKLAEAIERASQSASSLQARGVITRKRSITDVALLAVTILTAINTTLLSLIASGLGLGGLVTVVVGAVGKLLALLEAIAPGLLVLVVKLLVGVVGPLVGVISGLL